MNYGFKLVEERYIGELECNAKLFLHEKSGARFFYIDSKDDNNVFSISFRTPPVDNTGLTHILEHSVLCGSKKFPTKEPFVDLAKGSLNTFLNAMTFADKTMYPVASKNEKDFYNLVDVYMDAVLNPNIYECPEIMMQEGWHYDINDKSEDITYKGVVYNEMLGAFSSPEEILFSKIMESLYPDTSYGYESGGDPDYITDLSNESFLEYHKKYYHPANSYIYFYGNSSLDKMMEFLDHNYLGTFDKAEIDNNSFSILKTQNAFDKCIEKDIFYPVSSSEEEQDGTYISINFVVGRACDAKLSIGMDILEYILLETPASPLKKALIDEEIGRDVLGNYDEGLLQPMFNIVLKDSNVEEKQRFLEIVQRTLEELVKNGIDEKLIEASINSLEFKFREADGEGTPKGLLYGIRCMSSWIYDEDPFKHLEYEGHLEEIKLSAKNGYFEELIKEHLLDNTHTSIMLLIPKQGLAEEKEVAAKKRLKEYKENLTENEIEKLLDCNRKLSIRQNSVDRDEDREKIPMISLEDIKKEAEMPPLEVKIEAGTKVLYHKLQTNKIVYMDLLFDTSSVSEELLPYIALLSDVMGFLSTDKYTYGELSNEIDIHTGGISFNVDAYEEVGSGKLHPKFIVETKALSNKLQEEVDLINDILHGTIFTDRKRLWEILMETKADMEMELIEDGHSVATKRLCAYFSSYSSYIERLTGVVYYNFIADLEVDFDKKFNKISKNLKKVRDIIFIKENLITSITCEDEDYQQFATSYPQIVNNLYGKSCKTFEYKLPFINKNEGIFNSSNIVHVSKGYNYKALGYEYSGQMQVLKNILSLEYLWNKVRVIGGAYGVFARFEMSGNAYFASYRDPNLKETLNVYDSISNYLSTFEVSDREMSKYIIGAISVLDQPMTPQQSAQRADELYFRNISEKDIQKERDEILSTNTQGIRKFKELVSRLVEQNYVCVVGSESLIKSNKECFDMMYNVFDNSK
jgi:presequence protease